MLNRKVLWTSEALRLAPEPRHVKDIVEELGLTQAKPADIPMPVSAWQGGMQRASSQHTRCNTVLAVGRKGELTTGRWIAQTFATLHRYLGVALRGRKELLGRPTTRTHYPWNVQSDHSDWASDWGGGSRRSMSGGMLVHDEGALEILVEATEGQCTIVVRKRTLRCGDSWSGREWASTRTPGDWE